MYSLEYKNILSALRPVHFPPSSPWSEGLTGGPQCPAGWNMENTDLTSSLSSLPYISSSIYLQCDPPHTQPSPHIPSHAGRPL